MGNTIASACSPKEEEHRPSRWPSRSGPDENDDPRPIQRPSRRLGAVVCVALDKLDDNLWRCITRHLWDAPRSTMFLLSACKFLSTLTDVPLDLRTMPELLQGITGWVQQLAAGPRYELSGVIVTLHAHNLTHELKEAQKYTCWQAFKLRGDIKALPEGICNLLKLEVLDLEGCPQLEALPEGFGKLESLTSLNLSQCRSLGTSLPEGWTKHSASTNGEQFYHHAASGQSTWDAPEGTEYVPALPEGFKQLRLKELTLGQTPLDGAKDTYTVLGQIPTLTKLDLSYSRISVLPDGIGQCIRLEVLNLKSCWELRPFLQVFPTW